MKKMSVFGVPVLADIDLLPRVETRETWDNPRITVTGRPTPPTEVDGDTFWEGRDHRGQLYERIRYTRHQVSFYYPQWASIFVSLSDVVEVTYNLLKHQPEVLVYLLINRVLPICLAHLGMLVFHGSCVARGRRALAFLGPSRVGKSTLLIPFMRRGYAIMTDDVLVLHPHGDGFYVAPAVARVELTDQSLVMFGLRPEPYVTNPWTLKRIVPVEALGGRFDPYSAATLEAVYFLKAGQARHGPIVVSPKQAFPTLIRRTQNGITNLGSQFCLLTKLALSTACYAVCVGRGCACLHRFAERVSATFDVAACASRRQEGYAPGTRQT